MKIRFAPTMLILAAGLSLAACNKSTTDAQADAVRATTDAEAANVEAKADVVENQGEAVGGVTEDKAEATADAMREGADATKDAGEMKADAKQAAATATEKVKGTASDVAITTEVNARLARDTQLSALRINVDTTEGQVVLNGSAPDAAARERARTLAVGVDGVRGVDNRLIVSAKN